jgi:hypothetical protein
LTRLPVLLTSKECSAISLGTPGISDGVHVNKGGAGPKGTRAMALGVGRITSYTPCITSWSSCPHFRCPLKKLLRAHPACFLLVRGLQKRITLPSACAAPSCSRPHPSLPLANPSSSRAARWRRQPG